MSLTTSSSFGVWHNRLKIDIKTNGGDKMIGIIEHDIIYHKNHHKYRNNSSSSHK